MRRRLLGFSLLMGVGCAGDGLPDLGLQGSCNPTELDGCVSFDDTSAFADLYGYCTDTATAADDLLCATPMQELGVFADEVGGFSGAGGACMEAVLEDADALDEAAMVSVLASLRACLSQDTHEGDSTFNPPKLDEDLDPTEPSPFDEGSGAADGTGGGSTAFASDSQSIGSR